MDFVTSAGLRDIERALAPLGFVRSTDGRHFVHPDTELFIEFPSGPLMVGNQPVTNVEAISTEHGPVSALSPTDSVKDRLAAFFYWGDRQGQYQARMIMARHTIDKQDVWRWANNETNDASKLEALRRALETESESGGSGNSGKPVDDPFKLG